MLIGGKKIPDVSSHCLELCQKHLRLEKVVILGALMLADRHYTREKGTASLSELQYYKLPY